MSIPLWLLPALLSLTCFGVDVFLPKLTLKRLSPISFMFYYNIAALLSATAFLGYYGFDLDLGHQNILLGLSIGIIGTIGQTAYIFALKHGSLTYTSVITALFPVVTMLLAVTFLGETLSPLQLLGITLNISAISLMVSAGHAYVKEKAKPQTRAWLISTFTALFFWGLWSFLPKIAIYQMPLHSLIFYEGIGAVFTSFILLSFTRFKIDKDPQGIAIASVTGVVIIIGILAYYHALQYEQVSIVSTVTALYPAVAILLARIFLKERVRKRQWFAITLALIGLALLTR